MDTVLSVENVIALIIVVLLLVVLCNDSSETIALISRI